MKTPRSKAPPQDFAVARYNLDGTLDTSFAGKGWIHVDFGSSRDVATAVVVQPDGHIVVVGKAGDLEGSYHIALARIVGKGSEKSPTLSVNDIERLEGQSGTTPFTFTVQLSRSSAETVTVRYRTVSHTTTVDRARPDGSQGDGCSTWTTSAAAPIR